MKWRRATNNNKSKPKKKQILCSSTTIVLRWGHRQLDNCFSTENYVKCVRKYQNHATLLVVNAEQKKKAKNYCWIVWMGSHSDFSTPAVAHDNFMWYAYNFIIANSLFKTHSILCCSYYFHSILLLSIYLFLLWFVRTHFIFNIALALFALADRFTLYEIMHFCRQQIHSIFCCFLQIFFFHRIQSKFPFPLSSKKKIRTKTKNENCWIIIIRIYLIFALRQHKQCNADEINKKKFTHKIQLSGRSITSVLLRLSTWARA